MGYESAPATKLLATHCCICNLPLVDAKSVDIGIGPTCRVKWGYDIDVPEGQRKAANVVIYQIALNRTPENVLVGGAELRHLGFDKLAAILEIRIASVIIRALGQALLAVETPYRSEVVYAMQSIPGRRWDKEEKVNTFPITAKAPLMSLFRRFFLGELAVGPKGAFLIK